MDKGLKNYLVVTGGYCAFTLTDGAIRMLVVLYFHMQGYSPLEVAMLFLFYEFFGIVTNLVGGWLGARVGLNLVMHAGMLLQVTALTLLAVPDMWMSIPYVMFVQALSGIAKDMNKMSAKASIKTFLPDQSDSGLFKWIAIITGSKNAVKGTGFFVGALLLEVLGFQAALFTLAVFLLSALLTTFMLLPGNIGKSKSKPKFVHIFSTSAAINYLSAARLFLFGARDVWFVVGLPVFLYSVLGWSFTQVGSFLALWVIGYGIVQASAPRLLRYSHHGAGPDGGTAQLWGFILVVPPMFMAIALMQEMPSDVVVITGLMVFGVVFAINSAVHSYLVVAWSAQDNVSMNVGFYYMANAVGRLTGTVLSGWVYQSHGLIGCLWWSAAFILIAALISIRLPSKKIPRTV